MNLNILSKFLLLAQHPNKGRFLIGDLHINYGIIGAALLEMSVDEKITIIKDKLILIDDQNSNPSNSIDVAITAIIKESKKTRKLRYWLQKLARKSNQYKWVILSDLEEKGLVRIEHKKFLRIFPYKKSYLVENNVRNNLIEQLRKAALQRETMSNDTLLMLALVEACKMHKIIASDKRELKLLRKELKEIVKQSPIAETLNKTIQQMQAAIMIAIMASTSAAASSSN